MDKHLQEQMSHVYEHNYWGSDESRSGAGSEALQTKFIEQEVPLLFKRLNINSVLDLPCGDFQWMRRALLNVNWDLQYHGADIVPQIIEDNRQHESDNIKFSCMDITSDQLPQVDLIFSRDCLVHLSDAKVLKAFNNIKKSGAKYIAMTHFNWFHLPNRMLEDDDAAGPDWRRINFRLRPFYLPSPIDVVFEGSSEALGRDKMIAVWYVKDLPDCLTLS